MEKEKKNEENQLETKSTMNEQKTLSKSNGRKKKARKKNTQKYILVALSSPHNEAQNSLSHSHAIARIHTPIGNILCGWAAVCAE